MFSFGQFSLIPARQLLLRNGIPIRVGSRALTILTTLVEHRGELVTRDELMAAAWPKLFVHESNLKVNMANLRRSLGDTQKEPIYVATVIGRGYRFVAPIEISASANTNHAEPEDVELSGLPLAREIVGRDEEIARIVAELRKRRHVTVVGAGGIGKTTVAIAAAQALEADYSDGACFVDLSTFDDPMLLPSALAAALGLRGNAGDMLTAVIDYLGQRQMLVLLDNCEHILPAAAIFARRFAASVGRSRLLATSRQPLGTSAEHVVRLGPLTLPGTTDGLTIGEATRFSALDLFARRAAEWAGYELVQSDCAAVAQICRSLDGIPLAIKLAAANMVDHTAAELCAVLDEHLRFQNRHIEGQPARHETLLATIDWSYKLLPQNDAAILRIVSVFASAFEATEVDAVAEPTAIGPVDITICLGSLVEKSLLTAEAVAPACAIDCSTAPVASRSSGCGKIPWRATYGSATQSMSSRSSSNRKGSGRDRRPTDGPVAISIVFRISGLS
jgi:predicted ATPase/DNA-binding winged helix-turn-helix (wHTH) protein